MENIPGRDDLIVLNFTPQTGHEQAGRRNAIVLSPERFNEVTGFVAVCPITSHKKGYPFEVELPSEGITPDNDGYPIKGVILTDQIKSLDWRARNLKILKKYNPNDAQIEKINAIIEECLAKIATYLT
ncbi:type II toxin-antitoxin system PemK/MazF family toxin [Acetivibrio straminisolvens]|jgi:mRNA interferase MazF|uniref:Programmed cell death toxin MazF n=1 Tax=Acetivibrio straminisolvens JCM 21531 TaxID=1294263 RepID=W4VC01_9FIRM|nr:type II toxin-antitoxin system PemK/MazF family toxin [Acetivibrio straminisolvens]GAE90732.1 programmed cell death toxin MazF [Acetivibrio straminisolvens JCM 21531]